MCGRVDDAKKAILNNNGWIGYACHPHDLEELGEEAPAPPPREVALLMPEVDFVQLRDEKMGRKYGKRHGSILTLTDSDWAAVV